MKDRPPKPPTDSERQAIQAHRDRQAAQFQAIRLRILGPPPAPLPSAPIDLDPANDDPN